MYTSVVLYIVPTRTQMFTSGIVFIVHTRTLMFTSVLDNFKMEKMKYKRHVNDLFINHLFSTCFSYKPMPVRFYLQSHCPYLTVI